MKTLGLTGMVMLLLSTGAQAETRAQTAALLHEIDNGFICPEAISDAADRAAALENFSRQLAAHNISYVQATNILAFMLRRHGCSATVAEPVMADPVPANPPLQSGAVMAAIAPATPPN